ncbi:MAG: glycosyltransferase family 4 protein [Promethearchaeota archaeon]
MKVILITDDFYPNLGGIAHTLMNLYKKFQETEHELLIFNPYFKGKNIFKLITKKTEFNIFSFLKKKRRFFLSIYSFWKIFRDKTMPFSHRIKIILFFFTRSKEFINIFENICRLYSHMKKIDFNLLFCAHSGWIFPLTFVLSKLFNKKMVSMAHGNDFLIRNPLTLKTYFFKNCDKIIVSNKIMKRYIKEIHHLEDDRVEIINRGINPNDSELNISKEDLRKKYDIPEKQFVILSVGRHNSRKKFDLVIKAVNEIKKNYPSLNLKYYLIGQGEETLNLKKLTKELKLEKQVEFLGTCSNEKKNEYYKLSDLFIMPTISQYNSIEGFGIVFIEANYHKLPVIGTLTGGVKEAIIDGQTGFLLRMNDLNSLIEKILALYNDRNLRIKMGEAGHERVIKDFSWDNLIYQYISIFKKISDH